MFVRSVGDEDDEGIVLPIRSLQFKNQGLCAPSGMGPD
jgi:hypothetical protein